ncbi:Unknown protein [Striga hermonthica]|uniref:Uncharacterized protein n=1 Tax=Striga hermonthica TaxID=68872 RepID=A0A9N7MVW2_STRHE|nr:Unknown protein [Striga hermonthica]
MSTSGFGWTETGCMLDVKDADWDAYVKVNPKVRTMRLKSWPLYGDWVEIFGKDRATGEGAKSFTDAVNDVLLDKNTDTMPAPATPNDIPTYSFDPLHENGVESSSAQEDEISASSKRKRVMKRQRVVQHVEDEIVGMLSSLCDNANKRLTEMVTGPGIEQAAKEQRQSVYEAIKQIPELTTGQTVAVARYLCKNNVELDLFFTLDYDAKVTMVHQILRDM